ncbi:MAG: F0F1 ATP synthase subunit B [Methylovulum miyakonense]|uniref:F0F1 ATP synthase subunit B family protein n=1 Tax=Methylovulum miyakonense TaxID=645578 RepID=UPI003BB807C1
MLIDWFTVGAQTVNFLILVWLLKRFLYRPILHAIDERERRIAAALADADAKKTEAQKERDEFQHKNEVFDQQRAELFGQVASEAKAERQRLLNAARTAAEALRDQCMETLKNDAHNLNQAISRQTQQEVFAIARKVLGDLASASLEAQLWEMFVRRLRELDGPAKTSLAEALAVASGPVIVRSAFELPAPQCEVIQQTLNETLAAKTDIRFEVSADLISGIELVANGWKVAWSIADYVAELEKNVGELLEEQCKPKARPEPKPAPANAPADAEAIK